jgi:hypothetical protein
LLKKSLNDLAKDKSTLPFEVTYSERPGSKSRTSSLAVLLKPENVDQSHLLLEH